MTIARRSGDEWFVGSITNNSVRKVKIPLSFLKEGVYKAVVYTDGGEDIKTRTKVLVTESRITPKKQLEFQLKPSGGVAIHIIKMK